jgi:hypothetical protein
MIRLFPPVQIDAAEPLVERRAAAKQAERRGVDGARIAVEIEAEQVAQPANPGAVGDLGEYTLRIETRDEGLRADVMRNVSGRNANGAIGPVVDACARQCGDQDDEREGNPLSQRCRALSSVTSAPRPPMAAPAR